MNAKRWVTIVLVGILLAIFSGLPMLVGYLTTPADQVYVGRVPITAADTTAYYSNILQAEEGRLLFSNQFTSELQRPSLLQPVWLITGWIGLVFRLPVALAYQVARGLGVILFVALLWMVLKESLPKEKHRWYAIALITTASGLGWLWNIDFRQNIDLHTTPVDLWVAESTTFMSIAHSLLFIGSQALLLYILWTFWRILEQRHPRDQRWLGPALMLLALIHPYDLVTVVGVMAVWFIWKLARHPQLHTIVRSLVFSGAQWAAWVIPVVLYYLLVVLREPAMAGWLKQNVDVTSSLPMVLVGWGLVLPLAAVGALKRSIGHPTWRAFLITWFITGALLIYLPGLSFQRRLLNGLQIPLAMLAAYGTLIIIQRLRTTPLRWIGAALIVLTLSISSVRNTMIDIFQVLPQGGAHYPVRISRDEYQSMLWLRSHAGIDEPIFSEVWAGNTIPGLAGRTVVVGHGHQTLELQQRLRDWLAFRENVMTPAERTAMLERLRVHWLFWRPIDELPDGYQPNLDPRWQLAYTTSTVSIYRLQSN